MFKTFKTLLLALTFMSAGFSLAKLDVLDWPAAAQQAAPGGAAPATPGVGQGAAPPAGATLRSARESAAALAPDVKLVLDRVAKRVEALEALLTGLVEEARTKAIGYALWAAGGLFVLMFVSSLLGGTVAALLLRRSRSA